MLVGKRDLYTASMKLCSRRREDLWRHRNGIEEAELVWLTRAKSGVLEPPEALEGSAIVPEVRISRATPKCRGSKAVVARESMKFEFEEET